MGPIGRIKRCAALLEQRLEECFARFGMTMWEFDVLATLRRSGAPFCLTPTALFSTLMVTSGTMTHRMKSLETRGLVQRLPNPQDARSMLVQLTDQGLELIDRAVEAHLDNERACWRPCPPPNWPRWTSGCLCCCACWRAGLRRAPALPLNWRMSRSLELATVVVLTPFVMTRERFWQRGASLEARRRHPAASRCAMAGIAYPHVSRPAQQPASRTRQGNARKS